MSLRAGLVVGSRSKDPGIDLATELGESTGTVRAPLHSPGSGSLVTRLEFVRCSGRSAPQARFSMRDDRDESTRLDRLWPAGPLLPYSCRDVVSHAIVAG